jgi:type I restriction enzyme S subunit
MSADTSIREIPESWQISELGKVAKWGSGGTPKSGTSVYYGGDIPWAVIGDLTESWVSKTAQTITEAGLEKSSAKIIEPGTVMLAMYGASIGRTGIASVEMATNQAIAFAVPVEGILDNQFLLKYLQSQKEIFVRAGQGGAQPNISQTVIKPWPIPLPPIEEQMKIVELLEEQLSRLDAALASVSSVRKKAARFRRSLLQAGFSGELTGHDASTGITPDGWKTATIAEVAVFIRGVTYQKSDARRETEDGFLPLIRATNIGNESLSYDEFVFVPKKVVKPEQLIRVNDMVIAASSGSISIVGKSAPVLVDFEATFGAFCAVLRPQSSISPNFFRLYVQSPICRETWSNLARGTNINNLKREQVLTTSIPLPPLDEQEKIAEILDQQISHLDAVFAVADAIEKNASAMRRSLLHAAFTGELTKQWREDAHV